MLEFLFQLRHIYTFVLCQRSLRSSVVKCCRSSVKVVAMYMSNLIAFRQCLLLTYIVISDIDQSYNK
jgi:hypothetical protein